jgi:hypothetical protein
MPVFEESFKVIKNREGNKITVIVFGSIFGKDFAAKT